MAFNPRLIDLDSPEYQISSDVLVTKPPKLSDIKFGPKAKIDLSSKTDPKNLDYLLKIEKKARQHSVTELEKAKSAEQTRSRQNSSTLL